MIKIRAVLLCIVALVANPAFAQTQSSLPFGLSSIEIFFISVIVIATCYLWHKFDRWSVVHGPEVLTTIGILGCFTGIVLALFSFNTNDITNSVPQLLAGVKTAFISSVAGVLGALILRAKHRFGRQPIADSGDRAASIEDMVGALLELKRGLVGQEEGTLLTQMKLTRTEQADGFNRLTKSFDDFAKHMVENNQKALIEALKEVIRDFNAKLTEQFGENFKQLNQAVGALVVWQENYRIELDKLIKAQQGTATDMRVAADAFQKTVLLAQDFGATAARLAGTLELAKEQQDVLKREIEGLTAALTALNGVPIRFEAKLTELLGSLTEGVRKLEVQTSDVVRAHGQAVTAAQSQIATLLNETVTKAQRQLQSGLEENQRVIKDSVITLDKAMQQELTTALESLARQLGSLSNKFVADYGPLTERLREVVRMAEQRDRRSLSDNLSNGGPR